MTRTAGVRLDDFIKGGGKLPPGLLDATREPDPKDRADRETIRDLRRENAALRRELGRRTPALGQTSAQAARQARQIARHRAWIADRVALLIVGTLLALLFVLGPYLGK